jgi:hypothetical protein
MKLNEIAKKLDLACRTSSVSLEREVAGGYASDLLSDVMAHSKAGDLWVTLQVHPNIVAVASLREHAGIVLVGGREPQEETLEKAKEEGVPILVSGLNGFQLAGRLYEMGIGRG